MHFNHSTLLNLVVVMMVTAVFTGLPSGLLFMSVWNQNSTLICYFHPNSDLLVPNLTKLWLKNEHEKNVKKSNKCWILALSIHPPTSMDCVAIYGPSPDFVKSYLPVFLKNLPLFKTKQIVLVFPSHTTAFKIADSLQTQHERCWRYIVKSFLAETLSLPTKMFWTELP